MKQPRIAIAAAGKFGIALSARMNRTREDGTKKYGITVIRPGDVLAGSRWDVILMLTAPIEASQTERDAYVKWCAEYLPTKLAMGGEIIRMGENFDFL